MTDQQTLPTDFEAQMAALLGETYAGYKRSLAQPPPVSIRLNPQKPVALSGEPVAWCTTGIYLPERPVFTLDPLFHAGAYYVQEASSMFIEQVFRQTGLGEKPLRILDLCAAPGGKSTHVLSLVHPESLLVSNETIHGRTAMLGENIGKWGYDNALITCNDPKDFGALEGFFDVVIVDAPCSGEGLFRKDEAARSNWSLSNVQLCSRRQQRILNEIWPALKQDGVLIYSTCTHNQYENEEILHHLIGRYEAEPLALQIQPSWNIEVINDKLPGYRFYPHRVKGEGFFLAVLQKTACQKQLLLKNKNHYTFPKKDERSHVEGWLAEPERHDFILHNNTIRIIPKARLSDVQFLTQHLNVLEAGTALATVKQNKLVPEHTAALSVNLNKNAVSTVELSLAQALTYLRKETFELTINRPGFTLVTYKNVPVGWVNILPHRINNLYPSAWRIRMQY